MAQVVVCADETRRHVGQARDPRRHRDRRARARAGLPVEVVPPAVQVARTDRAGGEADRDRAHIAETGHLGRQRDLPAGLSGAVAPAVQVTRGDRAGLAEPTHTDRRHLVDAGHLRRSRAVCRGAVAERAVLVPAPAEQLTATHRAGTVAARGDGLEITARSGCGVGRFTGRGGRGPRGRGRRGVVGTEKDDRGDDERQDEDERTHPDTHEQSRSLLRPGWAPGRWVEAAGEGRGGGVRVVAERMRPRGLPGLRVALRGWLGPWGERRCRGGGRGSARAGRGRPLEGGRELCARRVPVAGPFGQRPGEDRVEVCQCRIEVRGPGYG